MNKEIEIKVPSTQIDNSEYIEFKLKQILKLKQSQKFNFKILKRSIDARKGKPKYLLRILYNTKGAVETPVEQIEVKYNKGKGKKVAIIGAGPAGYFAALTCLEHGIKPIVIERGKNVQARRRDLKAIQQDHTVNPESNYCFGEGGAGTYSDGKLYTRSKKRGKIIKVIKMLIDHGANPSIGIDAHPHIGSNKLPKIIANMRKTIEDHGGEVRFETKLTDFLIQKGNCEGVVVNNKEEVYADHTILATGHSARDIYRLLDKKGIYQEAKPFALGLRIEHPQSLIDRIQYRQEPREVGLPAASYKLVSQIDEVGVFSFCMCPGGLIVPAATAPGEIVVNGMSLSKRDSPFANSGIVTAISNKELEARGFTGVFANLDFQRSVEQAMFNSGDGSQKAPAQNLIDFINQKNMLALGPTSYIPGLREAPLHELLPDFIYERLKAGLLSFSLKLKGYYTDQAQVVGVESRTSAPVKIPRDPKSCEHPEVMNLFPCGEGAGYAGGILSAAMDGQRVVKNIASR